jgi:protein-S-isoprenylcysteine O-methyltransferase Ste14
MVNYKLKKGQKKQFKENPSKDIWGKPPVIIKTNRPGKNILISGWWGIARKINYLGDILMAISWCLTFGFDLIVPWFYAIYLTILLIDRARRDNEECKVKYGKYWDEYCSKVKYQIIPYVY